jgi:transposase
MITVSKPDQKLLDHLHKLEKDKAALVSEKTSLEERLMLLEARNAWLERQLFGHRSERIIKDLDQRQLLLFETEEPPEPEQKEVSGHQRRPPNRNGQDEIAYSPDLPVERIEIDLPEEEKICKETGEPLVRIGEEVSRKLALKPGAYFIKEIVRPKYAHPSREENGIAIAEMPDAILPRCRADESFLANLLVQKYVDQLPLYWISEILQRGGVKISRQLLSRWVLALGEALCPLYEEMNRRVLSSQSIYIDETPISLQAPKKCDTAYMWVIVGGGGSDPPYRTYHFFKGRQHAHAEALLKGYSGVVHSDKYGAYEKLAKREGIIWAPCWAHVRRKFFEAPGPEELREWVLEQIEQLFLLEREAWSLPPEGRLEVRQLQEKPIIEGITKRAQDELSNGRHLPKSPMRQALGYYLSLTPYLKNYLDHSEARLDNNVAERAIRPLALGRKNWLFLGSERGGHAAAVILSLVQSCRALGIHPYVYLEDILRRLPGHSNQRLHELLPDEWARLRSVTP